MSIIPRRICSSERRELPCSGEIWTVVVDGDEKGRVMIAHVFDHAVLAWPVLEVQGDESYPAFLLLSKEDIPWVVWPEAEFGLSLAALESFLGTGLTSAEVEEIRQDKKLTQEANPSALQFFDERNDELALQCLESACKYAWFLGDWCWPNVEVGAAVLDSAALAAEGISVRELGEKLQIDPGQARSLWEGSSIPTEDQLNVLFELLPHREDVLMPIFGAGVALLMTPKYKPEVSEMCRSFDEREAPIRSMIAAAELKLAARMQTNLDEKKAVEGRLKEAIKIVRHRLSK